MLEVEEEGAKKDLILLSSGLFW